MEYRYLKQRGALAEGRSPDLSEDEAASLLLADWKPPSMRRPVKRDWSRADLKTLNVPVSVLELVPESVARENRVLPLYDDGEKLVVAAVDPDNIALADKLRFILARDVELVRGRRSDIEEAINRHYGRLPAESVDSMLLDFTETAIDFEETGAIADAAPAHAGIARRSSPRHRSTAAKVAPAEFKRAHQEYSPPAQRGRGMLFYTVEEGQRVLLTRLSGGKEVLIGPQRLWSGLNRFEPMRQYIAHPGEFLIVHNRDGTQEHIPGPSERWFDPRVHERITKEECLQISSQEAVVVYSRSTSEDGRAVIARRIVHGPELFVPQPGEWLHTFSWHASHGGHLGVEKQPNALRFQKLWLMPDQMYHDVRDVRTADNAVLTIRLMIFFALVDIDRMLDATHDPIGDFVNATTADVVEFTGRYDFESFKRNTGQLNDLETYRTLRNRAEQIGYRIHNVVYRGYGAAESLQKMHDQAIEARTRLQLDRATEEQQQDLENFKLESQLARAAKRRSEQTQEVRHELDLNREKQEAQLRDQEARQAFLRSQREVDAAQQVQIRRRQDEEQREHLGALRGMGVDLTAFLTQARADRVIELRGGSGPAHVHLDTLQSERSVDGHPDGSAPHESEA